MDTENEDAGPQACYFSESESLTGNGLQQLPFGYILETPSFTGIGFQTQTFDPPTYGYAQEPVFGNPFENGFDDGMTMSFSGPSVSSYLDSQSTLNSSMPSPAHTSRLHLLHDPGSCSTIPEVPFSPATSQVYQDCDTCNHFITNPAVQEFLTHLSSNHPTNHPPLPIRNSRPGSRRRSRSVEQQQHFCPNSSCPTGRSSGSGRPFNRKDNLKTHLNNVHKGSGSGGTSGSGGPSSTTGETS